MAKITIPPSIADTNALFGGGTSPYTINADETTTLAEDLYCTDLTVPVGAKLYTRGWRIYCNGTATINGLISPNFYEAVAVAPGGEISVTAPATAIADAGGIATTFANLTGGSALIGQSGICANQAACSAISKVGSAGAIGAGAEGGSPSYTDFGVNLLLGGFGGLTGGAGGNGFNAAPTAGGISHADHHVNPYYSKIKASGHIDKFLQFANYINGNNCAIAGGLGGNSGGGGGGDGTNKGGGGGAGGAGSHNLAIYAKHIVIGAKGGICARGQTGGAGAAGCGSPGEGKGTGGGAGGCGGGGGFLHILCEDITVTSGGIVSVAGGVGGAGGAANNNAVLPVTPATAGGTGANGTAGTINCSVLSTGTYKVSF